MTSTQTKNGILHLMFDVPWRKRYLPCSNNTVMFICIFEISLLFNTSSLILADKVNSKQNTPSGWNITHFLFVVTWCKYKTKLFICMPNKAGWYNTLQFHSKLVNEYHLILYLLFEALKVPDIRLRIELIQGGPEKNGTAYFPQLIRGFNNWYQCMRYIASPEKNYTKIKNFGSVICFLIGHILWDNIMSSPKFYLFSLY